MVRGNFHRKQAAHHAGADANIRHEQHIALELVLHDQWLETLKRHRHGPYPNVITTKAFDWRNQT